MFIRFLPGDHSKEVITLFVKKFSRILFALPNSVWKHTPCLLKLSAGPLSTPLSFSSSSFLKLTWSILFIILNNWIRSPLFLLVSSVVSQFFFWCLWPAWLFYAAHSLYYLCHILSMGSRLELHLSHNCERSWRQILTDFVLCHRCKIWKNSSFLRFLLDGQLYLTCPRFSKKFHLSRFLRI